MTVPFILASSSQTRADMLRATGIAVEIAPARVDEAAIKASLLAEGAPARDIADALAEAKARRIGQKRPDAIVLGADQVLVCNNAMFDKPEDLAMAREQLKRLRGQKHVLLSAAVVFHEGRPVWRHIGRAELVMRSFSDAFLEDYLASEGSNLFATVGAYQLEFRGAQLFTSVAGDYFSILGLPLLELLDFLRDRKICQQ
ncbi:MAG: Maf family protein [Paracoccaceae bacterium]